MVIIGDTCGDAPTPSNAGPIGWHKALPKYQHHCREDVDMEKVANGNKATAADGCTQAVVEQQNQLLRKEVKLLHEEIDAAQQRATANASSPEGEANACRSGSFE